LTFVNPVFPVRVEYVKRLPVWRFAEARTENNIDPTHPVSRVRLVGTAMSSKNFLPVPKSIQHGIREHPGRGTLEEALAFAATSMAESRQPLCPHCRSDDVTHWGAAHGFPRYRCGSCRRTFNILTKTPLARLRNKERWPTFVGTMIERRSIRRSAAACEVSVTTSSRWHKRFLECSAAQRAKIIGEVIAAFSNTSALAVGPENARATDLAWAKELLPVVLSWLV
jgi:transposase-like protein